MKDKSMPANELSLDRPSTMEEGELRLPWFRRKSPQIQILLASACLFCNPGIYNAVTGLGAGGGRGRASLHMFSVSSATLYGVFTVVSFFGGTFINFLGPRITMLIGNTGYPLYIGALWYFDRTGRLWLPIFGGAYLGFCAGLLWSAASFTVLTYPEEKDKGKWRAIQWSFSTAGAVIGSIVSLGVTVGEAATEGVPEAVYIIFIVIQLCSAIFAAGLCNPNEVVRNDGSPVAIVKPHTLVQTMKGLGEVARDLRMIILIPVFYYAETVLVFSSSMNGFTFTTRTRNLNTVLVNVFQIPFSIVTGYFLDNTRFGARRRRGLIATFLVCFWVCGANIAMVIWVDKQTLDRATSGPQIDWSQHRYAGALAIYLAYGAQYGMFQNIAFWLMASFTNVPSRHAHMAGWAIGWVSAGTASAFGIDAVATPYVNIISAYLGLFLLAVPILFYSCSKVTETNYFKEDGVGVPVHVQLEAHRIIGRKVVHLDADGNEVAGE